MFPKSLFYIIFFIVLDLIMKSIKEKKEDTRGKNPGIEIT